MRRLTGFASVSIPILLLGVCFLPAIALGDATCSVSTACPGFSSDSVTRTIPVIEFFGQRMLLPPGVMVTAGDVLVLDGPGGSVGDLLRFFDRGDGMAVSFAFYSDDPGTEPPDTGLPGDVQPVVFSLVEGPGFPTFYTAGTNTYGLASDPGARPDVPEPGTLSLVGIGVLAALRRLHSRW